MKKKAKSTADGELEKKAKNTALKPEAKFCFVFRNCAYAVLLSYSSCGRVKNHHADRSCWPWHHIIICLQMLCYNFFLFFHYNFLILEKKIK